MGPNFQNRCSRRSDRPKWNALTGRNRNGLCRKPSHMQKVAQFPKRAAKGCPYVVVKALSPTGSATT